MPELSDHQWVRLLDLIDEHKVLPIVGPGLLMWRDQHDAEHSLESALAQALVTAHRLAMDGSAATMDAVVGKLKGRVQDLGGEMAATLAQVVRNNLATPPKALQQLAALPFKAFVSLTPDDCLATALVRSGRDVFEVIHSKSQATSLRTDLPVDWSVTSQITPLLYLFGKADACGENFAVHEEDRLEYAHDLLTRSGNSPTRFLDELKLHHLLIIGAGMSDWLYRFFLRLNSRTRLAAADKAENEWLSENFQELRGLASFVSQFSGKTIAIPNNHPRAFVNQLEEKWRKRHPESESMRYAPQPHQPRRPLFFVSYSRPTDAAAAERLVQELARELGEDEAPKAIWFDRRELGAGDPFWERIFEGIRNCAFFLPLISEAAGKREGEKAFVKEWERATERLKGTFAHECFIAPIVVDADFGSSRYDFILHLWRERGINLVHAPGGEPTAELRTRLVEWIRSSRRASA